MVALPVQRPVVSAPEGEEAGERVGVRVSAYEASRLVDRHERVVRGRIARGDLPAIKEGNTWRIDVDDLERIPGWQVDRDRLARLESERRVATSPSTLEELAARVTTLQREVRALHRRISALERDRTGAS